MNKEAFIDELIGRLKSATFLTPLLHGSSDGLSRFERLQKHLAHINLSHSQASNASQDRRYVAAKSLAVFDLLAKVDAAFIEAPLSPSDEFN